MKWSLLACVMMVSPAQPPADAAKDLVKVAVTQRDKSVKPGDTTLLGFTFTIKKDWHIYWPGQNDSGMATTIALTFPKDSGLTAGPPSFPTPKRHLLPGDILDYVHEGTVTITLPVTIPHTAKPGQSFAVNAQIDYLVCKESCIPGDATLATTISIADNTAPEPKAASLFAAAAAAQPKPQADGFDAAFEHAWSENTLTIKAKSPNTTSLKVFPAEGAAKLLNPATSGASVGSTLTLKFEPDLKPAAGVIELKTGNTTQSWSFSLARPAPSSEKTPQGLNR